MHATDATPLAATLQATALALWFADACIFDTLYITAVLRFAKVSIYA